jgi:hypothetical protein
MKSILPVFFFFGGVYIPVASTELVPELQPHVPNLLPSEKDILLGIAEWVPV